MDLRSLGHCVHHVAGGGVGTAEPADILGRPVARDHGHNGLLVRMVLVERPALLQHLQVRDQRKEGEDGVGLGHREVVDASRPGHVEPDLVGDLAVAADDVEHAVRRGVALGLVGEGQQLVGDPVDFGVGGHRTGGHCPVVVVPAQSLQCVGVQLVGEIVLFERQQLARVPDRVGVAGAHVGAFDGRVVGVAVAVPAEQRAARLGLQLEALGVHPAAAVIDMAALEAEHVHHALAVDKDVVRGHGRILAVRAAAIEGSVEGGGNLARNDLQVLNVGFAPQRRAPTLVEWDVRKPHHLDHRVLLPGDLTHPLPASMRNQ